MDWQIIIPSALSGAGVTALSLAALGRWGINKAIDAKLKKDQSTYEHTLQQKLINIESDLARISKKQEIAFSWLHQERAKVIAEIYRRFTDLLLGANGVGEYGIGDEEGRSRFALFWEDTRRYVFQNHIYFGDTLNTALTQIIGTYNSVPDLLLERTVVQWQGKRKTYDEVCALLWTLLQEIETKFKKLLKGEEEDSGGT